MRSQVLTESNLVNRRDEHFRPRFLRTASDDSNERFSHFALL